MTPLSAFWHRTRKQYVPLTGPEWDARANITSGSRVALRESGMVTSNQPLHGGAVVYEITPAGIEAHRASIMRAAT